MLVYEECALPSLQLVHETTVPQEVQKKPFYEASPKPRAQWKDDLFFLIHAVLMDSESRREAFLRLVIPGTLGQEM